MDLEDRFKPYFGKLFKYCSLESKTKRRWLYDQINNHQLYFADPNDFNDPFDCKIASNFSGSQSEVKAWANMIVKEASPNISKKDRKSEAKKIIKKAKNRWFNLEDYPEAFNQFGVACFSTSDSKILMWSHYADNHKGICLQFDSSIETNEITLKNKTHFTFNFANAFEVEYSVNYPNISEITSSEKEKYLGRLFTKAKEWEYEEELRIAIPEPIIDNQRLFSYPKEALTGIIFGCEIKEDYKQKIVEWALKSNLDISLYQAKKKRKEFGLDIEPIIFE